MEKILIIEDEEKISRFIELELMHEGYSVAKAFDGREGLDLFRSQPFDLILLDILLPSINGIEVLRRIRQSSKVPIIMLTAKDTIIDKVTGLDGGADDYITKPFAIEELLARIRVALRKSKSLATAKTRELLELGPLILNLKSRQCFIDGTAVKLTKKEFDLLQCLIENKNIVMKRELLLDKIWGDDYLGETNRVDVYIRHLRAKIEETTNHKIIHTVWGVGYVIKD